MKNKIKAIIFDLGNVLIGFDHRIGVKKILKHTHKSTQEIYDLFFDSVFTREFEKGKISCREFFSKVRDMLELQIGYEEFLPIWNEIFFAKPEMEAFAASLNSGRKLVLLSNVNQLHYEYLTSAFHSVFSLFSPDKIIPSFRAGFMKPDREIYELALAASGASAEEVVYVDDRADLIEAASGYGIRSIQFKNVEQLKLDFLDLGIVLEK